MAAGQHGPGIPLTGYGTHRTAMRDLGYAPQVADWDRSAFSDTACNDARMSGKDERHEKR